MKSPKLQRSAIYSHRIKQRVIASIYKYVAILSGGFLSAVLSASSTNESFGPILGDVTHESAKLWVYAEGDAKLELSLSPKTEIEVEVAKSEFSSSSNFIYLTGLSPDTDYKYKILIDGQANSLLYGHFKTSPMPGDRSRFSVAVISCLKKTKADWTILEKQKPDYLFLLGDNIYTHQTKKDSFERMRELYLGFRKNKQFISLTKNRPTLAVWDDHDMGPNDSDGTLQGKEDSLDSFKDMWPNPSYGTENTAGVFFSKQHGDVDFFMLDCRYHREPKGTAEARILGDEQFDWLIEGLKASQATFKIIANGSPINHQQPKDGWESWPWARKRLFDAIADNKINGVVFVGGDLHFADLEIMPTDVTNIPYLIYNIVSSGFTDSKSRPGWNYTKQKHPYVLLNFDTTLSDPTLEVIVKDKSKIYTTVTVNASELK